MARQNYAIICVITRMKIHVVIRAIVTHFWRVAKAICGKFAK